MNRESTATPKGYYILLHSVEISQLHEAGQRYEKAQCTRHAHFTRYLATVLGYARYFVHRYLQGGPTYHAYACIHIHVHRHTRTLHTAHVLSLTRLGDLLCTFSVEQGQVAWGLSPATPSFFFSLSCVCDEVFVLSRKANHCGALAYYYTYLIHCCGLRTDFTSPKLQVHAHVYELGQSQLVYCTLVRYTRQVDMRTCSRTTTAGFVQLSSSRTHHFLTLTLLGEDFLLNQLLLHISTRKKIPLPTFLSPFS